MRVALQPADTKLQAWFAKAVVVISVLRGLSLRVRIYVIPLGRTTAGINKEEDAGKMDAQIMSATARPVLRLIALAFSSSVVVTPPDRRQLVLPVASTIFAGRYGVIIRYGGTVDYRPTNQAIEAETYGRQDTGNGSGQGWDERAFSAQVAERPIAVAGETGASVAHSAGSLRRGVGG